MDKKIVMSCLCALIAIFFIPSVISGASFDCGKAAFEVEKLICGDDELSKLDESLHKAYLQALERTDSKEQMIKSQKQWLRYVRNACRNAECIKKAYETRMKELGGACTKDRRADFERGWLWTYTGSLGQVAGAALTLSSEKNKLSAVLYDPLRARNIKLAGQIFDDGRVKLQGTERSDTKIIFEGKFLENDPSGRFKQSNLNCEVISGAYTSPSEQATFVLGSEHGYAASIDHRYSRIGADDDESVEREAKRFIEAVAKRDKQSVATCMAYPVTVNGVRGNKIIYNQKQLLKDYDRIFKPEFSKAISLSRPYHMFVTKYDQASLGNGLVQFVGNGKVSVILNWNK